MRFPWPYGFNVQTAFIPALGAALGGFIGANGKGAKPPSGPSGPIDKLGNVGGRQCQNHSNRRYKESVAGCFSALKNWREKRQIAAKQCWDSGTSSRF